MAKLDDLAYSIRRVSDFLKVLDSPNNPNLNLEVSAWVNDQHKVNAQLFYLKLGERPDLREALSEYFQDQLKLYKKEMRELLDNDL